MSLQRTLLLVKSSVRPHTPKKATGNMAATEQHEYSDIQVGPVKQTWKRHIWDTLDKSPKERRFLLKLDLTLLTLGCLGKLTGLGQSRAA